MCCSGSPYARDLPLCAPKCRGEKRMTGVLRKRVSIRREAAPRTPMSHHRHSAPSRASITHAIQIRIHFKFEIMNFAFFTVLHICTYAYRCMVWIGYEVGKGASLSPAPPLPVIHHRPHIIHAVSDVRPASARLAAFAIYRNHCTSVPVMTVIRSFSRRTDSPQRQRHPPWPLSSYSVMSRALHCSKRP